MTISDDLLRDLAIRAAKELGDSATAETIKQYVNKELMARGVMPKEGEQAGGRAILTSFGLNKPGVVSSITGALSTSEIDILDISQKIMQDFFTMIMMIDITNSSKTLKEVQDDLHIVAEKLNIKIYLQHEDVFRFMHRI